MTEESWYYVRHEELQPTYVKGQSVNHVKWLMERYKDRSNGYTVRKIDNFEYEQLDSSKPPYRSVEERGDGLLLHEKRVNQAGSKGIYQVPLDDR